MWKKRNVVRWKNRWMNLQSRDRRREAGRELRETLPAEDGFAKETGASGGSNGGGFSSGSGGSQGGIQTQKAKLCACKGKCDHGLGCVWSVFIHWTGQF